MTKNSVRFYIVLAVIWMVFSVIALVAPFQHNTVFWLSYAFGVLAIALQAYSWPKAFAGEGAKSKFYGFPIARITTVYLIVQMILSLLFMVAGEKAPVWIPVILYVLLFGLTAISFIAADTARDEVERQVTARIVNTGMMKKLQAKAASCAAACNDPAMKKEIEKLAEDIRYSDPVSSEATERLEIKLDVMLDELRENESLELVNRTKAILIERNQCCRIEKNK